MTFCPTLRRPCKSLRGSFEMTFMLDPSGCHSGHNPCLTAPEPPPPPFVMECGGPGPCWKAWEASEPLQPSFAQRMCMDSCWNNAPIAELSKYLRGCREGEIEFHHHDLHIEKDRVPRVYSPQECNRNPLSEYP